MYEAPPITRTGVIRALAELNKPVPADELVCHIYRMAGHPDMQHPEAPISTLMKPGHRTNAWEYLDLVANMLQSDELFAAPVGDYQQYDIPLDPRHIGGDDPLLCLSGRWCIWSGQQRYTVIVLRSDFVPGVTERAAVLRGHISDSDWCGPHDGIPSDDWTRYSLRLYAASAPDAWDQARDWVIQNDPTDEEAA